MANGLDNFSKSTLLEKVRAIEAFRGYGVSYSMEGMSEEIAKPVSPIKSGIMFYSSDTANYYGNRQGGEPQQLPNQPQSMGTRGLNVALNCGGAAFALGATVMSGGTLTPITAVGGSIAALQCGMSVGRFFNGLLGTNDSVFDSDVANNINYVMEAVSWICGIGEIKAIFKSAGLAARYPSIGRLIMTVERTQANGTAQRAAVNQFINSLTVAEKRLLAQELKAVSRAENISDQFRVLMSNESFRRQINSQIRGSGNHLSANMIRTLQEYVDQQIRVLSLSISGVFTSAYASTQGGIASVLYDMVRNKTLYVYFYDVE